MCLLYLFVCALYQPYIWYENIVSPNDCAWKIMPMMRESRVDPQTKPPNLSFGRSQPSQEQAEEFGVHVYHVFLVEKIKCTQFWSLGRLYHNIYIYVQMFICIWPMTSNWVSSSYLADYFHVHWFSTQLLCPSIGLRERLQDPPWNRGKQNTAGWWFQSFSIVYWIILPINSYFSRWLLHHQPDRVSSRFPPQIFWIPLPRLLLPTYPAGAPASFVCRCCDTCWSKCLGLGLAGEFHRTNGCFNGLTLWRTNIAMENGYL